MSNCVYIDLGDGDFIKPNFSKPPTKEMIEEMRQYGLKQKQEMKDLKAKGLCWGCKGTGKIKRRDLDTPGFKLVEADCRYCNGTGKEEAPHV